MQKNEHRIRVLPRKSKLPVPAGLSLLEGLMRSGIFLRADCGGRGSCGKCRVELVDDTGVRTPADACQIRVDRDLTVGIPDTSMASNHIMDKAALSFPPSFSETARAEAPVHPLAAAVDLGTTTIAVYLCSPARREVVASVALKNPQSLYGADVMSRITAVSGDPAGLDTLQALTVKSIQWGLDRLLSSDQNLAGPVSQMVVVGNPTMIHILAGVDPASIGTAPYHPAFYDARQLDAGALGFTGPSFPVRTLPNVAGFLGGDILAAAQAADMDAQPDGTLLVDLGTNGELILKQGRRLFATSCATGPAFEGAALACGIQAVPGAVNGVDFSGGQTIARISTVAGQAARAGASPGICGAGVINAVAQFRRQGIVLPDGKFASGGDRFTLIPENPETGQSSIYISQKDIRSVQLGKSALFTGIRFLLDAAGLESPEKLIIAGAFGAYLPKADLICLGLIPDMDPDRIVIAGNLAGAGAVMAVCDHGYIGRAAGMARQLETVELALNLDFQQAFVENLRFPDLPAPD